MTQRNLYVYSDGSFNTAKRKGVTGYLIFDNDADHVSLNGDAAVFAIEPVNDTNNIRVEFVAAIRALTATHRWLRAHSTEAEIKTVINLFTDSAAIASLPGRRAKLEATGYISKRKGTLLSCADLYAEFNAIQDTLNLKIHTVRGHAPAKERSIIERNFSGVDWAVRKALRRTTVQD